MLGCALLSSLYSYAAAPKGSTVWVGTWAAAPVKAENTKDGLGLADTTYRQIVRTSLGGKALRITLSNEFGTEPLHIAAASVALVNGQDGTVKQARSVTFSGASAIVIPPGALVMSDRVPLEVTGLSKLAVDLFIPAQTITLLSRHHDAFQTNYEADGDQTGVAALEKPRPYTQWNFLKGIDVEAPAGSGAIVILGDSITDGNGSTANASARWTDVLAERLQANPQTRHLGLLNEGISGNRLLRDQGGMDALARFDRDVLSQSGVRYLVILEGINDIGHIDRPAFPSDTVTADDLTFALTQLVERAHTHGIRVILCTLPPYPGKGAAAPQMVALQQEENAWIRKNTTLDGVIDFYALTHDPEHPSSLLPVDDSGDHLHPGNAGYKAMGDGIDLHLFTHK